MCWIHSQLGPHEVPLQQQETASDRPDRRVLTWGVAAIRSAVPVDVRARTELARTGVIKSVDAGVDLVRVEVARAHEHVAERVEEPRVDGLDELTV